MSDETGEVLGIQHVPESLALSVVVILCLVLFELSIIYEIHFS